MLVTLAVGMSAPSASGWGPTETLCTFHADGRPEGSVLWETRHSFRWRRLQSARKPSPCPICPSAHPPPRSCHLVPASHVCSACSVLGGPGAEVVGGRVWGLVQSRITPRSWLQLWGCHWNRDRPGTCSPSLGAGPEWATWALSGMIRDIQGCASLPTPVTHYRHPVSSALDIFFIFITALVAGMRG